MTRSRSNTPPRSKLKSQKIQFAQNQNQNLLEQQPLQEHPHRVQFSPISSSARRGSSSTCSSSGGSSKSQQNNSHGRLHSKESIDRDKQKRQEMVKRAKARRERLLKRVRMEKKIMLFSSILAFLALFLWFVAVFTDHWFYLKQTEENIEKALNSTTESLEEVFVVSNTGLWRTCSDYINVRNREKRVECSYFSIFLTNREEANRMNPTSLNEHVVDYTRAQICFAFISVLLMMMTIIAAFYTFKNSRYVYKRLAACLYYMTTISVLVVLEVLMTSVGYAEGAKLYPEGAVVQYGFSFYLGWTVFLVYLVNGCIFLILSRKRKDLKDEDLDGNVIMGR